MNPRRRAAFALRQGDGNALVEFALVLPLLLLIFAGIVDFGFLFQRYEVLTNAAREGARVGVLPGYGTDGAQQRALDYVGEGLGIDTADASAGVTALAENITVEPTVGTPFAAVRVTASLTYNYVILGPIVNLATRGGWGTEITINASSTMRREIVGS